LLLLPCLCLLYQLHPFDSRKQVLEKILVQWLVLSTLELALLLKQCF
jgi:hypothetical protein